MTDRIIDEYLYRLYEKLYFHEIQMRANLFTRLQVPAGIIVVLIGFLGYLMSEAPIPKHDVVVELFWMLFIIGVIAITAAIYYFFRSFFNHSYKYQPTAVETETYRVQLVATYKDWEDSDSLVEKHMKQYLYQSYINCSTANAENNTLGSECLHRTNRYLIMSIVFAFMALIPLKVNGLQPPASHLSDAPKTEQRATSREREERFLMEEQHFDSKKDKVKPPPPPPPPPPADRVVKEGNDKTKKEKS